MALTKASPISIVAARNCSIVGTISATVFISDLTPDVITPSEYFLAP